mmetsp:Transcript_12934/g.33110  ORF Transcript_12934/g.33110 Transcript_12934/m.33110 type:complete len:262 (-) Transcript_12934:1720-2505(-)
MYPPAFALPLPAPGFHESGLKPSSSLAPPPRDVERDAAPNEVGDATPDAAAAKGLLGEVTVLCGDVGAAPVWIELKKSPAAAAAASVCPGLVGVAKGIAPPAMGSTAPGMVPVGPVDTPGAPTRPGAPPAPVMPGAAPIIGAPLPNPLPPNAVAACAPNGFDAGAPACTGANGLAPAKAVMSVLGANGLPANGGIFGGSPFDVTDGLKGSIRDPRRTGPPLAPAEGLANRSAPVESPMREKCGSLTKVAGTAAPPACCLFF